MVDFSLTPEQEQLIEETRALALKHIIPIAGKLDYAGDDHFDFGPVQVLAGNNLLTPNVPREFGGRGLNHLATSLVAEELGAACAGVATVMLANMHAATPIILAGSPKQKQTFLPLLTASRPNLAALALTEPEAGSDVVAMSTVAVEKDGLWEISGEKEFVINGGIASFTTLFAMTDSRKDKAGMVAVIIPQDAPGFKVGAVRNKMGIRYARTTRLLFNQTPVPVDLAIGPKGTAYLFLMQTFDRGRAISGAVGVGIARAAYEFALEFSKQRHQFGRPIFSHQAVSFALAEMATRIESSRLMVWKACWLIDHDLDYTMASSMAKIAGSQVAQYATAQAMDICGGRGYLKDFPLEKYLRDARALSLLEGTNHIQKAVIASQL
ncbi:MAG TPA: acyl-CoA dehydrogenase [Desulfotomaculum sp.]|nr:MAG: hypothetical protein JL56_00255 [Desulfotomaculum sp. BICA1-6]HBX22018.1 acyl-CoA dehydrogenase [Desulfotomaculum sp.]